MSRGVAVISAKANNLLRTQRDALASSDRCAGFFAGKGFVSHRPAPKTRHTERR